MACLPHNLKAFGNGSEKVFWVFFGVDGLKQYLDALRGGEISNAFQAFHTVGVHLLVGQARNAVTGKKDEARALEFPENRQQRANFPKQRVALRGIAETGLNPAGGIHHHAKLVKLPARAKKLVLRPALPLAYEFDGVVPRIRDLREALLKRKLRLHGPEHHGKREWCGGRRRIEEALSA